MSLALNEYYSLASSSGGGGAGASYDGLDFPLVGLPSQSAGSLTFTLFANGLWECPVPRFSGTEGGNWFSPTTPGIGAGYEAQFSFIHAGDPGTESNGAPTWTAVDPALSFTVGLSGSFVDATWAVTCEIRDAATLAIVATGTFYMSISLT